MQQLMEAVHAYALSDVRDILYIWKQAKQSFTIISENGREKILIFVSKYDSALKCSLRKKLLSSLQTVFSPPSKQCTAEATYLHIQEKLNKVKLLTEKLVVLQNQSVTQEGFSTAVSLNYRKGFEGTLKNKQSK